MNNFNPDVEKITSTTESFVILKLSLKNPNGIIVSKYSKKHYCIFPGPSINTKLIITGLSGNRIVAPESIYGYISCIAFDIDRIIRLLTTSNVINSSA